MSLAVLVAPGHATGIRKIGPWAVITYDRPDGSRDAAVVVSARRMPFGLALRCIDGNLSAALIPQSDDRLFGPSRRAVTLSFQPDGQAETELEGAVGDEHSILLKAPAPVMKLILASRKLVVSVSAVNGGSISSSLDLAMGRRALADLVKHCPVL